MKRTICCSYSFPGLHTWNSCLPDLWTPLGQVPTLMLLEHPVCPFVTVPTTLQSRMDCIPPFQLFYSLKAGTFAFPYPAMCLGCGRDPDSLKFWPFTYKILASKVCRPQLGLQKEILIGLGKWTLLFYASKLLSLDSNSNFLCKLLPLA